MNPVNLETMGYDLVQEYSKYGCRKEQIHLTSRVRIYQTHNHRPG